MSLEMAPVLPNYAGACTSNVVPELIKQIMGRPVASWMPENLSAARQVVVIVVDGLGWEQLQERKALAPTIDTFVGGPITTIAPTSTASGLTSIVTGRPPSAHGLVAPRMSLPDGDTLDVLPWRNRDGDARTSVPPTAFQTQLAFAANEVPVITQRSFIGTGFTDAHLQGARVVGYSAPSSIAVDTWRLVREGNELVYVYYGGLDAVAHANGFGDHYDAELYTVDRMLRDLLPGLPEGTGVVVTSDHGQVHVGGKSMEIDPGVQELCWRYSGEGRFRWLHAQDGRAGELYERAKELYQEMAWVVTVDEVSEGNWFGGPLDDRVRSRIGDVALVASAPVAFNDPNHSGERQLQCRHGSLTSAEVLVPLVAQVV